MIIGIVTISFNQAGFLAECIRSVALRAGGPHELAYVIVDPGSTDKSRSIIQRNCSRFTTTILEPDRGPADGLNKGFAACDADIYGFINADDYYLPAALDTVGDHFQANPGTDIVFGKTLVVDAKGRVKRSALVVHDYSLQNYLDHCCTFAQQAMFVRRELFRKAGGFRIENRTCWDSELMVDMLLATPAARIRNINLALAAFRLYPTSISGSQRDRAGYQRDRARIEAKIKGVGIYPSDPLRRALKRLLFLANPVRHWRCVQWSLPLSADNARKQEE